MYQPQLAPGRPAQSLACNEHLRWQSCVFHASDGGEHLSGRFKPASKFGCESIDADIKISERRHQTSNKQYKKSKTGTYFSKVVLVVLIKHHCTATRVKESHQHTNSISYAL
jgi:hypothetical protein